MSRPKKRFNNPQSASDIENYQKTYLLLFIDVIGSQAFLLMLNLSPLDIHIVPSLPPMQYKAPSKAATPHELRLDDILGTGDQ